MPLPIVLMLSALLLLLPTWSRCEEIRMNQIQVIGTHNSYHIAPHPEVLRLLAAARPDLGETLRYTHKPLDDQFTRLGIRQIELDIFADPDGGLFANPLGRRLLLASGTDPDPDYPWDALRKPGLKVLHVQDLDYRSTVPSFVAALQDVRRWSRANPDHVPILILVEAKDQAYPGFERPFPFGARELDSIEGEILSVFPREELLTPDDVRGDFDTLPEAIRERGWPTLVEVRGRVLFALDNGGAIRDLYLEGHPALRGRLMFADAGAEDAPAAAWFKVNDAVGDFDRIQRLVADGFLVRTRADANTAQARINDSSTRDKALASGAQFVSTDYPEPDLALSEYQVQLPGKVVARINPVNGNPRFDGIDMEPVVP